MLSSTKKRLNKEIKTSRSNKAMCSEYVLIMLNLSRSLACAGLYSGGSFCQHQSVIRVSELGLCTRSAVGERVL